MLNLKKCLLLSCRYICLCRSIVIQDRCPIFVICAKKYYLTIHKNPITQIFINTPSNEKTMLIISGHRIVFYKQN